MNRNHLVSTFVAGLLLLSTGAARADLRGDVDAYLDQNARGVEKELGGLSPAQLKWKPAADKWSVGEVVEHIVTVEAFLRGAATATLAAPADPAKCKEVKGNFEAMKKAITDRSEGKKAKAPEQVVPKGVYATAPDAQKAFVAARKSTRDFLASRPAKELQAHCAPIGPAGMQDVIGVIGFAGGHAEVKASKGFPTR
jgi:hypothetical protein